MRASFPQKKPLPRHSLIEFLEMAGLKTSHFPHLIVYFEVNQDFRGPFQCFLPLRIPSEEKCIYPTLFRLKRTIEVSDSSKKRRKFLEVEWLMDTDSVSQKDLHPLWDFLPEQLSCRECQELFTPQPEYIDDTQMSIACPGCYHSWRLTIQPFEKEPVQILLDLYESQPEIVIKKMNEWENKMVPANDDLYFSLFPMTFEKWTLSQELEKLFSSSDCWQMAGISHSQTFQMLAKNFLNMITLHYLKEKPWKALDSTRVQKGAWIHPLHENTKKIKKHSWLKIIFSVGFLFLCSWTYLYFFKEKLVPPKIPKILSSPLSLPLPKKEKPIQEKVLSEEAPLLPSPPQKKVVTKEKPKSPLEDPKKNEIELTFRQGMLHLKLQQAKEAERAFKKVLTLDSQNRASYRGLGLAYVYDQRFDEAIQAFEHYLKMVGESYDRKAIEDLLRTLRQKRDISSAP